jgi:hypothetical protein
VDEQMTDYDHIIEKENPDDRSFALPERFHGEDCVIRQQGGTTTHQGRTLRWEASSQNNHLEVNQEEGWFEVEASIFGEDRTDLIKVETPEGYFLEECEYCDKEELEKDLNDVRFSDYFDEEDTVCDECKLEKLNERRRELRDELSDVKHKIRELNGRGNFKTGDLVKAPAEDEDGMKEYVAERVFRNTLYLQEEDDPSVPTSSNLYKVPRQKCEKVKDYDER